MSPENPGKVIRIQKVSEKRIHHQNAKILVGQHCIHSELREKVGSYLRHYYLVSMMFLVWKVCIQKSNININERHDRINGADSLVWYSQFSHKKHLLYCFKVSYYHMSFNSGICLSKP